MTYFIDRNPPMVYGNQVKIGQFLNALAQGFVQTRLEILLLFLFLIALLLVFTTYLVAQKRAADREMARRSREMLEHLLGKLELNENETGLLGRLAAHLDGDTTEYALLVSRHVFEQCAQKAIQSGEASEVQLNSLRLKIGFRITQPEEIPASSAELPEGSPVLLEWAPGKRLRATIIAQGPGAMAVKPDQGVLPSTPGARLRLYFHNSAGIFTFPTSVTGRIGDTVHLEHSSSIVRLQRRSYYRRKEQLPVFVKTGSAKAGARESVVLDLGGGGASLQNPRGMMREGDLLEVSFSPRMEKLTLVARVLRVSRNRKVIHVKFESLSENERKRIMGFLFTQSEKEKIRPS
jgi:PilZ domain